MATYSHSRVSTFENCPYKYKLQYVDKVEPDITETIELFMGKRVHETLEKLYKNLKFKKSISKATLLKFYRDNWEKEYSDDILVVKEELTANNYKKMGKKFIEDYYEKYKPFNQLTILDLETQDIMTLPDGNQWHVRIDKFACDDKGNYYVCDYKTNATMKDQEEADSDRQLAMYSIWVKDKFKDAKSVKLLWHMLAFNKEVISERTPEQEKKLQEDVMQLIKKIEKAVKEERFPRNQSPLCNYCGYRNQCPSFKHQLELEEKPERKFKEDEGVIFVDEYSKIKAELYGLNKREEELKDSLIEFAKQKGIDVIYGSNMKCSVKDLKKVVIPDEIKEELVKIMKEKGVWEEYEMVNHMKFNSHGRKGELHEEIQKLIELDEDWRLTLSKRKDLEEGEE
jgi:putative RecB family exonuclease